MSEECKIKDIPVNSSNMHRAQIRTIKKYVGEQGTRKGLRATEMGGEAWRSVQVEILEKIKQAARSPESTRDNFILSGAKLETYLNKRFKKGALEEIFGKQMASDLLDFAEMARGASLSERLFANFSGTSQGMTSTFNGLIAGLFNPKRAAASVLSKAIVGKTRGKALSSGRGKRFLLGTTEFQKEHPLFLSTLSRTLGQATGQGDWRGPQAGRE